MERYVVVLYDKTSSLSFVNEAREKLFCCKSRTIDNIPPTQDALLQHTRRAVCNTKLEFGQAFRRIKFYHLLINLLGPRLRLVHGSLFGKPFHMSQKHVLS